MITRCYNERHPSFKNHGGRGISVCDRWRESFEKFFADMGEPPTRHHSLDRINNDGNYEPSNCRWATVDVQRRNSRQARMLTHNGETMCVKDWAERIGVAPSTLCERLRRGWSVDRALTTPARRYEANNFL
jgi:hypothetical protein